MTKEEQEIREEIGRLAMEHIERGDATGWFDELYKQADGNIEMIPWADLEPNRFFVEWDKSAQIKGDGRTALVVGCGLGDEAVYLAERGFKVTAFDISEKAIEWASRIHADLDIEFLVADLFRPPSTWIGAFDFIIEVYTIQALPVSMREKTIDAIASFLWPGGEVVVVQRLRTKHDLEPDGPPWAVSRKELKRFQMLGFEEIDFHTYLGDEEEPIERFVALFKKTS